MAALSIEALAVTSFTQMLRAMAGWLDKAAAHAATIGDDGAAVMSRRLAPDMFPLASQPRFACIHALETLTRLRNEPTTAEVEALRSEALAGQEHPGTMDGARLRITETLAKLSRTPDRHDDDRSLQRIRFTLASNMTFDLDRAEYVRDWALPQFYFHLNTTYAILRAYGVQLGKANYVGHMMAYRQDV